MERFAGEPARIERGGAALRNLCDALYSRYTEGQDPAIDRQVTCFLGAAVSYWSGLPTWTAAKKAIFDKAVESFQDNLFVAEAWRTLSPYIGPCPEDDPRSDKAKRLLFARASVEQICSVACDAEVVGDEVREVLLDFYRREKDTRLGEPPQLAHELIAHLLRHDFIDNVVTFNFDEVLDTAIENEMGPGEYDRIVSGMYSPRAPLGRRPKLIKLHGTISLPSTLRFTRDDTLVLSPEMIEVLDQTICGATPRAAGRAMCQTHLLSLGYSWRDPGIVNWLESRLEYFHAITIVQLTEEIPDLLVRMIEGNDACPQINLVGIESLPVGGEHYVVSLDELLWAINDYLETRLEAASEPFVSAARHVVLGYLFGPQGRFRGRPLERVEDTRFMNEHTGRSRRRVESLLHLVKCSGMANLSVMARDPRIHRYQTAHEVEPDYVDFFGGDSVTSFARSSVGEIKETYFAEAESEGELIGGVIDDLQLATEQVYVPQLSVDEHTPAIRGIECRKRRGKSLLQEQLERILHSPEVEVVPASDPRSSWLFDRPKPVLTYRDLRRMTTTLLETAWTHLLVVAESGEWLLDQSTKTLEEIGDGRTVLLVTVDDFGLTDWKFRRAINRRLKDDRDRLEAVGLRIEEATLPWFRHNRHLTMAIDESGGKKSMLGGIYFRRRLKTSRISPVRIGRWEGDPSGWDRPGEEQTRDFSELFVAFMAYAKRACRFARGKEAQSPGARKLAMEVTRLSRTVPVSKDLVDRVERIRGEMESLAEQLERQESGSLEG